MSGQAGRTSCDLADMQACRRAGGQVELEVKVEGGVPGTSDAAGGRYRLIIKEGTWS